MLGESLANGYNLDLKDAKIDGRVGQPGVRSESEIEVQITQLGVEI